MVVVWVWVWGCVWGGYVGVYVVCVVPLVPLSFPTPLPSPPFPSIPLHSLLYPPFLIPHHSPYFSQGSNTAAHLQSAGAPSAEELDLLEASSTENDTEEEGVEEDSDADSEERMRCVCGYWFWGWGVKRGCGGVVWGGTSVCGVWPWNGCTRMHVVCKLGVAAAQQHS